MTVSAEETAAELCEASFRDFFAEVHDYSPFPWQTQLLERVLRDGWPALIDVPTGLGKTAVLDVAVFAAALGGPFARRRVFLVVDRRVVVDQAHEHALQLQRALANPQAPTTRAVADALTQPGDDVALDVTRMRGGTTWSWLWLERPDRHAVITGTVDQIGSRLLFRGYGVGQQLWPIDAALVGNDSLVILDEAHLSHPFLTTLRDVTALTPPGIVSGPAVVAMSASPGEAGANAHRISEADKEHPVARRRLLAPKQLHLVSLAASKEKVAEATADALASWALRIGGPGRVTGVIANTVAVARAVFSRLQATAPDPARCALLTGRVRAVDREYLMRDWYPLIRAGARRDPEQAVFVVATQAVEVGADIDLDGLVTQSASFAALVQRLGRLNRRGDRANATAVVVHADAVRDPVYGVAAKATWEWIATRIRSTAHKGGELGPGLDVSPSQLRRLVQSIEPGSVEAMNGAPPYAPLVSSSALGTWARTSPVPHPDVPVSPYLHGIASGEATAAVAWRGDIDAAHPEQWHRTTDLIPPSADELIELPISAVRRWLATLSAPTTGETTDPPGEWPLSDAESHAPVTPDQARAHVPRRGQPPAAAFRYASSGNGRLIQASEVSPGDVLVVPATRGGCDRYGWFPASTATVIDVADLCANARRGAATIRVGATLAQAVDEFAPGLAGIIGKLIEQVGRDLRADTPDTGQYRLMLREILNLDQATGQDRLPHQRVLSRLAEAGRLTTVAVGVTTGRGTPVYTTGGVTWNNDSEAAGTCASPAARPTELGPHQAAVRDRAVQFAGNLGLPAHVARSVWLAAAYHDEGKRDPRFQLMLHAGDRWLHAAATAPLAKSGMDPADRAAFRRAQQLSGYPVGMRHEALSARIAKQVLAPELAADGAETALETLTADLDLIIHLIASHHGHSRPLLPPVTDPEPQAIDLGCHGVNFDTLSTEATVDWDAPSRFAALQDRYGIWGLAFLETIVRLADIWCSVRSEESR